MILNRFKLSVSFLKDSFLIHFNSGGYMKHLIISAMALAFSASTAFAAGQTTEIFDVTQDVKMEQGSSITATPNSASGGIGVKSLGGAFGHAEYMGTVEVNTIDAAAGSRVRGVSQSLKMEKNTHLTGSAVKVNTIKTRD